MHEDLAQRPGRGEERRGRRVRRPQAVEVVGHRDGDRRVGRRARRGDCPGRVGQRREAPDVRADARRRLDAHEDQIDDARAHRGRDGRADALRVGVVPADGLDFRVRDGDGDLRAGPQRRCGVLDILGAVGEEPCSLHALASEPAQRRGPRLGPRLFAGGRPAHHAEVLEDLRAPRERTGGRRGAQEVPQGAAHRLPVGHPSHSPVGLSRCAVFYVSRLRLARRPQPSHQGARQVTGAKK
mmetsp:Transcript_7519/g.23646  ORF Transcript_7519/g.23646 Transcript_7519/m.23646 type:complete len:240 (-) Transcript_7519:28-747(-)